MQIELRSHDGVSIVKVHGKITINDGSREFHRRIRELVAEGHSNIIIHLGDVHYVDSTGVGALVASFTTITNAGGELRICNVDDRVRELLNTTNLHSILSIHGTEQQALQSI